MATPQDVSILIKRNKQMARRAWEKEFIVLDSSGNVIQPPSEMRSPSPSGAASIVRDLEPWCPKIALVMLEVKVIVQDVQAVRKLCPEWKRTIEGAVLFPHSDLRRTLERHVIQYPKMKAADMLGSIFENCREEIVAAVLREFGAGWLEAIVKQIEEQSRDPCAMSPASIEVLESLWAQGARLVGRAREIIDCLEAAVMNCEGTCPSLARRLEVACSKVSGAISVDASKCGKPEPKPSAGALSRAYTTKKRDANMALAADAERKLKVVKPKAQATLGSRAGFSKRCLGGESLDTIHSLAV